MSRLRAATIRYACFPVSRENEVPSCRTLPQILRLLYTAVVGMTPAQCREARKLLNWSAADLARAAGVSVITVRQFEDGKVQAGTRLAPTLMRRALEGGGILFGSTDTEEVSLTSRT
jgi:DNA-binding XRE family transcriptional regulator